MERPLGEVIILIGSKKAGKTQLLNSYLGNNFVEQYTPTTDIYLYFKKFSHKDNNYHLHFNDFPVQGRYASFLDQYCRTAKFIVICIDLSNDNSIVDAERLIKTLSGRENKQFLVVGTKADIERHAVSRDITAFMKKQGIPEHNYIKTSAKSNINVQESFDKLIELVIPTLLIPLKPAEPVEPNAKRRFLKSCLDLFMNIGKVLFNILLCATLIGIVPLAIRMYNLGRPFFFNSKEEHADSISMTSTATL